MIVHIAAIAENNVIGDDGNVPWDLPEDMRHFKETTVGNTVVMGRKTFDSIGRPLPDRDNVVVTSQEKEWNGVIVVHSIEEALDEAESLQGDTFIIGGASVYEQTMGVANKLVITHVHDSVDGDAYYPQIDPLTWDGKVVRESDEFTIKEYTRK